MDWYFSVAIFIISCGLLSWLSSRLIKSLVQVAKYLRWREFTIAFFVMAFAASLPNLFIDLNAALQHKPELAFGDIVGGNLVDLTFVLAIAVFFSKKGISAQSSMVQESAVFTAAIAVLPLLLILDGNIGRIDGLILLATFGAYSSWLFSKSDRFKKHYHEVSKNPVGDFKNFLLNIGKIIVLLLLLFAASQAVIASADFFSQKLGISLALVGILIVGLGNAFPEAYFCMLSARKNENWLVLGDLMGSVIICATLVLGLIGLIAPFEIHNLAPFATARLFLMIAAIFSFWVIRSGNKITKKEGLLLMLIYIVFLIVEVFAR